MLKYLTNFYINFKKIFSRAFIFQKLAKYFNKSQKFDILDIGCGYGAIRRFKNYYPNSSFYGITLKEQDLINGELQLVNDIKFVNLENSLVSDLYPKKKFDLIILSHFIEHLTNSERVLKDLINLSKRGTIIYIETPSEKSLTLPSMRGTLNFYDDKTHKKQWSIKEIISFFNKDFFIIRESGIRRDLKRIIFLPLFFINDLITKKDLAHVFWDLLGFAHYVVVQSTDEYEE